MYLSLNWLKDLVNIPKSIAPEEIGAKLTLHTVEVEKISKQAERFNNVVVGKVLEVVKHPNSDRLNLTKVDVGQKNMLSIVCGAPNVAAGQLVPVALIGAELPSGMKIEEREVRGEKSFGMICAPDELGLGDDHAGIMVLDKKAKIGQPFGEYLKLDDVIFEVDNKSLSNRPDLWGHLGIAREIGVLLETKPTKEFLRILSLQPENNPALPKLNVKVSEPDLCPRYSAIGLEGIEIKASPEWMQKRLSAVGLRPINNIVDATNYAMLELGQPMHAFDASLVSEISVRTAEKGEKIKTLDGEERILDESMLVIANKEKALAIAGVMGGEDSEINSETKNIILEAANFKASAIRQASAKLGLRTESSMRFEKSLDPDVCAAALARCAELIKETCPQAKISTALADIKKEASALKALEFDLRWAADYLGEDLGKKQITKILEALGFGAENISAHFLKITIPSWRATKDISSKEDVLEEIARIYGYDKIKNSLPLIALRAPEENIERKIERRLKNILALGAGLSEVYNYSFVSEDKLIKMKINPAGHVRLLNPLSGGQAIMRQNLIANLLDNVKTNQAKYEAFGLFEIGSIFWDTVGRVNKGREAGDNLPFQEKHLALLEASARQGDAYEKLKGELEYLLRNFSLAVRFESGEIVPEWADKKTYAKIIVQGEEIGLAANASQETLSSLGLKKEIAAAEISLEKLLRAILSAPAKIYERPNKYPAVARDLAFVVDANILYNDLKEEIEKFDSLISSVELFDVYAGANLPRGQKSLAFHLEYSSPERTLESAEIDALQEKLAKKLEEKFEAKVRNF